MAGGSGTRLHPVTKSISKQLIPIYDKPMIYYSLSALLLAGIRDVLIISTPNDIGSFRALLGDGSQFGCCFSYEVQAAPKGLAQAFTIGAQFIANDPVALVLGDNLFHGAGFSGMLKEAHDRTQGATIFGLKVGDPERFGVAEVDDHGKIVSLEEKPAKPKSNIAVTGLYFYDNDVIEIAKAVKPSARGEYEITSINNAYLESDLLHLEIFPRGMAWLDTGTHQSIMEASQFVYALENRGGVKIACLEEIALMQGWIDMEQVKKLASQMGHSTYAKYLKNL